MPPAATTGTRAADGVDDLRQQGHQAATDAVAAGLAALRHQHVGAGGHRLPRHRQRLHLAQHRHAGALDARQQLAHVAEGEHHERRLALERQVEQPVLARQAPGDEADAETRLRRRQRVEFAPQPVLVAVAAAEQAEPAGGAHRGGEARVGHDVHRREQHRVLDREAFGQRRAQRHGGVLWAGWPMHATRVDSSVEMNKPEAAVLFW